MATSDVFLNAIRQSGRRVTEQRRVICNYLANTRVHPSPSRVFDDISREHPEISRATIYNTLNVLQDLGAIVEISFGDGHTHYETNMAPHVNLVCLRCHEITDVPVVPDFVAHEERWLRDGFYPLAVKMDVFGFCEKCSRRRRSEIREEWLRNTRNGETANNNAFDPRNPGGDS
ncbi:MAG: Fur family transcriptional regulator [Caldilineaceae bacterium]